MSEAFNFGGLDQETVPRPSVTAPAPDAPPAVPIASPPASPAAPQTRTAAAGIGQVPNFRDQPIQALGLFLQHVGAGMQGQTSMLDRMRAQAIQADQLERQAVGTGITAMERGIQFMRRVPEAQRGEFAQTWGQNFERVMPGFTRLFQMAASVPNAEDLIRAAGEHADVLVPLLRGAGPEEILQTLGNRTLMDRLDATADARNRGPVAARLGAIREVIAGAGRRGLIPQDIAARVAAPDNIPAISDAIIGRESGGNPEARNPASSATGAGQFIDSTWLDVARRHAQDLGIPPESAANDQQLLALRTNPQMARRATEIYARENAQALEQASIPATPGNLYTAHFLGPQGAVRFLQAAQQNPNQPVSAVVSAQAYQANKAVFERNGQPLTVAQVQQNLNGDIMRRMQGRIPQGQGVSLGEFEALNRQLPEQFRLSPSEMGTLRRNPDLALSYGIVPPALQQRVAERQTDQATASPHFQQVERDGRRFLSALDPQTGRERWSVDIGNERFNDREFRAALAMRASGLDLGEQDFSPEVRRTLGRLTQEQAVEMRNAMSGQQIAFETGPDGTTRLIMGPGAASGMTASQQGQQIQNLQNAGTQSQFAINLINRMRQQLASGSVATGIVGTGIQALAAAGDQLQQLAGSLTPEQRQLLDVNRYRALLPTVQGANANDIQRFHTNLITLAYAIARARDPRGQVTERDINRSLSSLGTGTILSDRGQMDAALDETARGLREGYRTQHETVTRGMRNAPPMPEWAQDQGSGSGAPAGSARPPATSPVPRRDGGRGPIDETQLRAGEVYTFPDGQARRWTGQRFEATQ